MSRPSSSSSRLPAPRQEEPYYLLPKGTLATFSTVFCDRGVPAPAELSVGCVQWRPIDNARTLPGFFGEYDAKEGREVDELVVFLIAQIQSHAHARGKQALPILVGWLNPMGYQVPVESRWVYDIRNTWLRPRRGTTMQQRQLNNMIRQPPASPPARQQARRNAEQQAPGAPRAKRTRQRRRARDLAARFDEEAERAANPYVIHDDMEEEEDEAIPPLVNTDGEVEEEEEDEPEDMQERRYLLDLAMDALRGAEEYRPADVPRGVVVHLGRDVRVRGGARRQEPQEVEPEEAQAQNLFAQALAGQMMGHALPQRRGTFMRGGVAIPITISRSRVVESPQPPKETTQERIRRMKAALSVSDDRNRDPAERDTACVVCTNEYATEHNIHEAERVLRVVLDGCNHELCRNCSLAVDKCPICRKEMTGTSTEKSGCADCMVRSALITPSVVRMLPCQHLCLCRGCADARAVDASFVCPVCLENADNWQVVG